MYNETELAERLVIIKNAGLEDAMILDENYMQLIKGTYNTDERDQLRILQTNAKTRVRDLEREHAQ